MKQVINGLLYDTETAVLLAHDCYWDGQGWDRRGRNVYLYRTPKGRYFVYRTTRWQGEMSHIEPLTEKEARSLYEALPVHEVDYQEAFGKPPEEA